MASRRHGTLYIGSTVDLLKRAWEHRTGVIGGFTRRYGCKLLVWYECTMKFRPRVIVSAR